MRCTDPVHCPFLAHGTSQQTSPDGDADQPSDISGNACVPNLAQLFLREWVIDNVFAKSLFQSGLAVQAEVFPKFWWVTDAGLQLGNLQVSSQNV